MAKYKNIQSVAHNFGYSFLSDLNFVGSGRGFVLVPEAIFDAARQANAPLVRIDFARRAIEPAAVALSPVQEAVANYAKWLPELLESQAVRPDMVSAAYMTLRFNFGNGRPALSAPDKEVPDVECVVALTDDRGVVHTAQPVKWPYD